MVPASLTSLSTPVKKFMVLSFIMVYHAALGCPKHLIDALGHAVNPFTGFLAIVSPNR